MYSKQTVVHVLQQQLQGSSCFTSRRELALAIQLLETACPTSSIYSGKLHEFRGALLHLGTVASPGAMSSAGGADRTPFKRTQLQRQMIAHRSYC
jgi:hypothetical protein